MKAVGIRPDVITYSATISTCNKENQPLLCMETLKEAQGLGIIPELNDTVDLHENTVVRKGFSTSVAEAILWQFYISDQQKICLITGYNRGTVLKTFIQSWIAENLGAKMKVASRDGENNKGRLYLEKIRVEGVGRIDF